MKRLQKVSENFQEFCENELKRALKGRALKGRAHQKGVRSKGRGLKRACNQRACVQRACANKPNILKTNISGTLLIVFLNEMVFMVACVGVKRFCSGQVSI